MKLPIGELSAKYDDRPDGSVSKLSTYRDGVKILLMITRLFFLVKPLISFSILSGVLAISAIIIGWVQVVSPLLEYGVITKYPSVILSSSLMVLSILLFISGVIINAISNTRKDYFRLLYLSK